jgi:hypothetical protein
MTHDMGTTDRIVRMLVAVVPVVGALVVGPTSTLGILLRVVAGLVLEPAEPAYCPVYTLLGTGTLGRPHSRV